MAELVKNKEGQVIDYMARDFSSLLHAMRQQALLKLPEWTDLESEADFGNVLLQLFAHMGDIIGYYQDRIANESFLGTARERRSIIHHLALVGYRLATAAPASTTLTLYFPAGCTGSATLRKGDAFATKSQKDKPSVRFEYNGEDQTIDCTSLPADTATGKLYVDIQVEQGRRIDEDILGTSDGTPNQRFDLAYSELILRPLSSNEPVRDFQLLLNIGSIIDDEWRRQDTLAFSTAAQKDFIIEIDENDRASVMFGDGQFGAIPPTGAVIRAAYRTGGGSEGNVGANTIKTIVDAPELSLLGATVNNTVAATGGSDRESIDHAVMHAPHVFRSQDRAVAQQDYEALALNYKGVGKVRAEAGGWNRVHLYVAPDGGGELSDVLRANLLEYFEDKRPLSTIVEIEDVDYVKIYVKAEVELESYYSKQEKREEILDATGALLAFEHVDFGEEIYLSKFYEAIEAIDGVKFTTIKEFRRESATVTINPEGKILLEPYEVPRIPGTSVEDPDSETGYAEGIYLSITGGY